MQTETLHTSPSVRKPRDQLDPEMSKAPVPEDQLLRTEQIWSHFSRGSQENVSWRSLVHQQSASRSALKGRSQLAALGSGPSQTCPFVLGIS